MKKRIIIPALLVLLNLVAAPVTAFQQVPDPTGSWLGSLTAGAIKLRVVFNITTGDDGALKATMDSPDQGVKGIPLGVVTMWGDSIKIDAPMVRGSYIGKFTSDSAIEGEWSQSGQIFVMNLVRQEKEFALNRPQEPKPPYPYLSQDVTFSNEEAGIVLAGTITRPEGEGSYPAVVMVSGSGQQNRDEEIFGHKPFKLIADYLSRNGVVVLRYDDRGVAGSGGDPRGATSADFAQDAKAALNYLKSLSYVNSKSTGIIGHSEGGLIAMLLASETDDVDFIISMAGPGTRGDVVLTDQEAHISKLMNVPDSLIEINSKLNRRIYNIISAEADADVAMIMIDTYLKEFMLENYGSEDGSDQMMNNITNSLGGSSYNWMRYFINSDPAIILKSVTCPVLAINGSKDCQVLAVKNINAIKQILSENSGNDVTAVIFPGLNHLFQPANTGLVNEYGEIETTMSPEVLKTIADWIMERY